MLSPPCFSLFWSPPPWTFKYQPFSQLWILSSDTSASKSVAFTLILASSPSFSLKGTHINVDFAQWYSSLSRVKFFLFSYFWSLSIVFSNSSFYLFQYFSTVPNYYQWINKSESNIPHLPELKFPGFFIFIFICFIIFAFMYIISVHDQFSHLDLNLIPGSDIYYVITSNFWSLVSLFVKWKWAYVP